MSERLLMLCILRELARVAKYYWGITEAEKHLDKTLLSIASIQMRKPHDICTKLHAEYDKRISKYASEVLNNPERAMEFAERLLSEPMIREFASAFIPRREVELELIDVLSRERYVLSEFGKRLWDFIEYTHEKGVEQELIEAMELLLEHATLQISWILNDPKRYVQEMTEFFTQYENDAREYLLLSVSSVLLLRALSRTYPLWRVTEEVMTKRKALIKKLLEVAEELDSFTATFQLVKEPIPESNLKVVAEVSSIDELRRVLGA